MIHGGMHRYRAQDHEMKGEEIRPIGLDYRCLFVSQVGTGNGGWQHFPGGQMCVFDVMSRRRHYNFCAIMVQIILSRHNEMWIWMAGSGSLSSPVALGRLPGYIQVVFSSISRIFAT